MEDAGKQFPDASIGWQQCQPILFSVLFRLRSIPNRAAVIPGEAAFQAETGISRCAELREIPQPAGESAGFRDDAARDRPPVLPPEIC